MCVSVARRGFKACVNRTPLTVCVIKTVHVRMKKCVFFDCEELTLERLRHQGCWQLVYYILLYNILYIIWYIIYYLRVFNCKAVSL